MSSKKLTLDLIDQVVNRAINDINFSQMQRKRIAELEKKNASLIQKFKKMGDDYSKLEGELVKKGLSVYGTGKTRSLSTDEERLLREAHDAKVNKLRALRETTVINSLGGDAETQAALKTLVAEIKKIMEKE